MSKLNLISILLMPTLISIVILSCEKDNPDVQPELTLAEEILKSGNGLRIGVASTNINPTNDVGFELGGYGPRYSTGTHDTLSGRCMVMMDDSTIIALISLDLIGVNRLQVSNMKYLINNLTGIDINHIFIHATHTHSGPSIIGPVVDLNYLSHLYTQIGDAAVKALNSTKNCTAIIKSGIANAGTVNRRNPERTPTNQFNLIEFRDIYEKNIATVLNYSCHPVVLGPNSYQITADYVYYLRNEIENQLGGMSLFFNGSFGDLNPPTSNLSNPYDRSPGTFADAESFGTDLATEMLRNIDKSDTLNIRISCKTREAGYRNQTSAISILNLGQLQIAMVPGEPLQSFGEHVMDLFPGPYKMIFGATNDFIAYIVPVSEWGQCSASFLNECYEETLSDEGLAPLLLKEFEEISNEIF